MQRSRITTDWPTPILTDLYFEKSGSPTIHPSPTWGVTSTHYLKIEDQGPGLRRYGLNRISYKPVSHVKIKVFPVTSWTGLDPNSGYTYHATNLDRFPQGPWTLMTSGYMPQPSKSEIDSCCTAAFQQWSTVIPDNVSIANFIWELREVKSLLPRLLKFRWDFYHKGILGTPSLLRAWANGRINLETLSSNYLAYQFGWKPLLADLKKLANLVPSVLRRMEFLKRSYRKWTKVSFARSDFAPRTIPDPPSGGTVSDELRFVLSSYRADFHASAYQWHDLQGLDDGFEFLRAFATALGLNRPGRVLWNAIPFSFVIDWFVKLGDWVDKQTTADFFGGSFRIFCRGTSIKETCRISCWYRYFSTWTYGGHQLIERYQRSAGMPIPVSALVSPELTGTQASLAAALLHGASSGHFVK
jgi:hypothetical protein